MIPAEARKEIEDIMANVEFYWRAEDGGLAMAASDLIVFGKKVVKEIEADRINWICGLDDFGCSCGAKSEIVSIAQEWAFS